MRHHDRLTVIAARKEDELSVLKYTPSFFKPFLHPMEPLTLKKRLRFVTAFYSGFCVYYLKLGEFFGGDMLVQRGNDPRYPLSNKEDIWIGPVYIAEAYRGRRYMQYMLRIVDANEKYASAFAYVDKNNISSLKSFKNVGYSIVAEGYISKIIRKVKICGDGNGTHYILQKNFQQ